MTSNRAGENASDTAPNFDPRNGLGVPQDNIQAAQVTPADLSKVQQLARDWLAKHQQ